MKHGDMTSAMSGAHRHAATDDGPLAAALQPVLIGCSQEPADAGREALVSPEWLGFKAFNLARMAAAGIRVPEAFVLPTRWQFERARLQPRHWQSALAALEDASGLRFGDARRPLVVSVRSGAAVSMPGMMETLLNIGLCDTTLTGLVRRTGHPRLVWDAYRRLIAGFGEIVAGLEAAAFDADLQAVAGGRDERALDYAEQRAVAQRHLATYARLAGHPFPQDPHEQLRLAIEAVFASWDAEKARTWRRMKSLDEHMGTAVTVQRMVFGNGGGRSGAGVGFTRNPSSGEPQPWVDFLFNAQGEDVVSGRRDAAGHESLAAVAPAVWRELCEVATRLERLFGDMQDFEFTVEDGKLWLLQARTGKRTPLAAARIALDLHDEGLIDRAEARARTRDLDADALTVVRLQDEHGRADVLAEAASACAGVVSGEIALDEARARARRAAGTDVVLVRHDAETGDIAALEQAVGLLTVRGARTSHAAVVARQLGKVCLVGCAAARLDLTRRTVSFGARTFAEGDALTLDGHAGRVLAGRASTVHEAPIALLHRLEALRSA